MAEVEDQRFFDRILARARNRRLREGPLVDTSSYRDAVRVLADNGVLDEELAAQLIDGLGRCRAAAHSALGLIEKRAATGR
jgi:hypothetical protein